MTHRFHPEAEAEHYGAVAYYESKRAGLGVSYLEEFDELLKRVTERPHAFHIERSPDLRRAHLVRFPYAVIYREVGGVVQVLAIAHKRRQPGYWARRS